MNRRQFMAGTLASAPLLTDAGPWAMATSPGDRPASKGRRLNVLHVISDQHNARCLGSQGHPLAITPNMDRLARQGTCFTHAYTQNPICTPSRTSIFTGQYCHNHGYYGLSGPAPARLPGFLGHFRQNGYRTAALGKLHTPNRPKDWLLDQCDFYGECYNYEATRTLQGTPTKYMAYLKDRGLLEKEDSVHLPEFPGNQQNDGRPSLLPFEHSIEGWCVQEATRFIDECGDRPFCMQVSFPKPHQCYTPDKRFWDIYPADLPLPDQFGADVSHRPPHFRAVVEWFRKSKGLIEPKDLDHLVRRVWRAYLACITHVDHGLGLLIDHLEKTVRAGNTIVIYGADHGAYSGMFGVPEKAPGICSEAVCRVPFIWRVPGMPQGNVCRELVENIDIASTITSLCGLPPMDTTDGCDLSPLLRGAAAPVRRVAVTENVWSKSLRWDRWRLVHYQPEMFAGQDVGELYDIDADPWETRNLYHDPRHRDTVEQGRRLLLEWLIRTTRAVTLWPPLRNAQAPEQAGDGKQSNKAGPAALAKAEQLNYL
jgi:arylsulfatase